MSSTDQMVPQRKAIADLQCSPVRKVYLKDNTDDPYSTKSRQGTYW